MSKVKTHKIIGARSTRLSIIFFLFFILLSMQFDPYNQSQLANIATLLIAVLSITILTGASGQISLGQGAIMAVGGYGSALLVTRLGMSMWLAFILAIFISALFGLFLGLAAARLSGPYLAGTTLVMALAIPSIAVRFESFFSGDIGLSVDYGYPPNWLTNLIGEISIEEWSLYVALPFAALALFAVLNLSNSRSGRTWRAVRDNEVSAALAGINIARTKVIAFVCASALAGLAGAIYGFRGLVAPTVYPTDLSLTLLTAAVIGGLRSIGGAIFGTFVIVFLPDLIGKLTKNWAIPESISNYLPALIIGLLLLLTVILNPRGSAGALEHIRHARQSRKH
ncbi:MAG: branched-chain amino acid ABC transporter permease [Actinomycetes bacterium]